MNRYKNIPPKSAKQFLRWFLRDDLTEEVQGDLEEEFYDNLERVSPFRAKMKYWFQVLNYLRPFAIKGLTVRQLNNYGMFQNYFKIGWRNLVKNKGYSVINIGGLALGMAVALLIGLWIYDELSFDRYHQNYNRIARVIRNGTLNGETFSNTFLPYALGDELRTKYGTNFKHVVMALPPTEIILSREDRNLSTTGMFIEAEAPEMFSLEMEKGSWNGLKDPHSILISASLAHALFGEKNPMEQLLRINNDVDVKVTGVYKDLPRNTQLYQARFFAPWDLVVNDWMKSQGFEVNFLDIYVELRSAASIDKVTETIKDILLKNVDNKEYLAANPQLFLHPMSKWHLQSEWKNGVATGGLIQFVWLFGLIGAFVLLLACINFMNLSTARSENRAREVGIRKTMGSMRRQLVHQFFSESILIVFLAFIFSLLMVAVTLNWFNELAGKQMSMPWTNMYFWLACFGFILFTGILAGSYPALYLSSFKPVKVLKGVFRVGRFASLPRKVLVVTQFTVSVSLVIGTIIVYQQIQYAKNRPVGYNRDALMMIKMNSPEYYGKLAVLRNELKNTGVVEEMAQSGGTVTGIWASGGGFFWKGKDPSLQVEFATLNVTQEYGKTVGWQFVNGGDFSGELIGDSLGFIINEAAAKLINLENPVDEIVRWEPGWRKGDDFRIIGVIKDMVMESPYASVKPTVFYLGGYTTLINIKINPNVSPGEALTRIENVFKEVVPNTSFDYKFADQEYALKFAVEERIGKLASVFSSLAILISCLGLFGLASFVAEQRTKEFGIRKVLGASISDIWRMLSGDFVVLVIISCCIAIPIAYYYLSIWLQNYEYRTGISWWVFMISGTGAIVITLMTVSFQALKAALMNPVNCLRSE